MDRMEEVHRVQICAHLNVPATRQFDERRFARRQKTWEKLWEDEHSVMRQDIAPGFAGANSTKDVRSLQSQDAATEPVFVAVVLSYGCRCANPIPYRTLLMCSEVSQVPISYMHTFPKHCTCTLGTSD